MIIGHLAEDVRNVDQEQERSNGVLLVQAENWWEQNKITQSVEDLVYKC